MSLPNSARLREGQTSQRQQGRKSRSWAGVPSAFIATKTDAASRSCTCWCLEISSLEVNCHWGVCSHLHVDC
jgi:hypothetical protein